MKKTGGKRESFTVLGGKISFWKKGGGAKISYFREKYTPGVMQSDRNSWKIDTFQEALTSELMISS